MNNKIKIDNFWKAGGICEIELYPDIKRFINTDYILFANSNESLIEADSKLFDIYIKLRQRFNINIMFYRQLIRNVRFMLNGISYTMNENTPFCELKDNYLIATGKYYRGATL